MAKQMLSKLKISFYTSVDPAYQLSRLPLPATQPDPSARDPARVAARPRGSPGGSKQTLADSSRRLEPEKRLAFKPVQMSSRTISW
jgi:hypothetical protein